MTYVAGVVSGAVAMLVVSVRGWGSGGMAYGVCAHSRVRVYVAYVHAYACECECVLVCVHEEPEVTRWHLHLHVILDPAG